MANVYLDYVGGFVEEKATLQALYPLAAFLNETALTGATLSGSALTPGIGTLPPNTAVPL